MATALDKYADMKPQWDEPVMIESHQNGIRTKAMNPNTPVTDDELVEDAIRCWDAGATAIHDHNSTNLELLQEVQAIARDVGRPLATQDDARRIYNIT